MDSKLVGAQIARLRKEKRLTQNDLGDPLGVSFQAVSKCERGERRHRLTALSIPSHTVLDVPYIKHYLTDFAYSVGVIPNFSLNCREKW